MSYQRTLVGGWHSKNLDLDMELICLGKFGQPYLVIPDVGQSAEDLLSQPHFQVLSGALRRGTAKLYLIDNVDDLGWFSERSLAEQIDFARRFDRYVVEEAVSFIRHDCRGFSAPIGLIGIGFGGYHAVNLTCRHPAEFAPTIAVQGQFKNPYHNQQTSYDSELHYLDLFRYLPFLNDNYFLPHLQDQSEIHFLNCDSELSDDSNQTGRQQLRAILNELGIAQKQTLTSNNREALFAALEALLSQSALAI